MPTLELNLDAIAVETFDPAPAAVQAPGKPRTFEPGCTNPEFCGTGREF